MMPEKCPVCGCEINGATEICSCGFNVKAWRLETKLRRFESAIKGWRTVAAKAERERDEAIELLDPLTRYGQPTMALLPSRWIKARNAANEIICKHEAAREAGKDGNNES